MDAFLSAALSNALAASVLALGVALLTWVCRRPALGHALWLLVLLKLVTPPLFHVPLEGLTTSPSLEMAVEPNSEETSGTPSEPVGELVPILVAEAEQDSPEISDPSSWTDFVPSWAFCLSLIWGMGSAVCLAVALTRIVRFARLLRRAPAAPPWLLEEVSDLSGRLGVLRVPTVSLTSGAVAPLIWAAWGRPHLLLPSDLLARLGRDGRRALLAHELAHVRRGDHRVRWLELLVTALYWWHPVVWWARHQLREAEEQCCDAWALWALPGSARTYALTLVETVDFLSEAASPLPVLASGFGHADDLRRRVTMIMRGTTPRALNWASFLAILGLGAFLLPVMPSQGQEQSPKVEKRTLVERAPGVEEDVVVELVVEPTAQGAPVGPEKELELLRAELRRKQEELIALQKRMEAAAQRYTATRRGEAEGAKKVEKEEKKAEIRMLVRDEKGKTHVIEVPADMNVKEVEKKILEIRGQGKRSEIREVIRVVPPGTPVPPRVSERAIPMAPRVANPEADRRFVELERRLAQMAEELARLRHEIAGPGAPPRPGVLPRSADPGPRNRQVPPKASEPPAPPAPPPALGPGAAPPPPPALSLPPAGVREPNPVRR